MNVRSEAVDSPEDGGGIDLLGIWDLLWAGKWLIIACAIVFGVGAGVYAFTTREWYRAEVLMTPAEAKDVPGFSGALGGLGGLASLAGINVGNRSTAEPLAVSTSRDFLRDFIRQHALLPVLFSEKWDPATKNWKSRDPKEQPDLYDGVKKFREDVLSVREDKKTGLVMLAVEWTDAATAAAWANNLVDNLNNRIRQRALVEAESNVAFLQKELTNSSVVALQQSMGRLLESEMQKLMLARGNMEFAFRVVDRAEKPKLRERPKRMQLLAIGIVTGGVLGVFVLFFRRALRRELANRRATQIN